MAKELKRRAKTDKVRHQGPSQAERLRGPNFGAWQSIWVGLRRDQSMQRGISDPERFRPSTYIQK